MIINRVFISKIRTTWIIWVHFSTPLATTHSIRSDPTGRYQIPNIGLHYTTTEAGKWSLHRKRRHFCSKIMILPIMGCAYSFGKLDEVNSVNRRKPGSSPCAEKRCDRFPFLLRRCITFSKTAWLVCRYHNNWWQWPPLGVFESQTSILL
jgi:hypothetical protein